MKKITISRKSTDGSASAYYTSRGLDTPTERETALQEDCIACIKAFLGEEKPTKSQAEKVTKMVLAASAAVHSDLERILRNHGKKSKEGVQ